MLGNEITLSFAFVAGLASFFSPCFFPVIPGFFALMGAQGAVKTIRERAQNFFIGVSFVVGFSVVFFLVGSALLYSVSFIDPYSFRKTLSIAAGVLLIIMGSVVIGFIPVRSFGIQGVVTTKAGRHAGAFLFGAGFAATWSPCVGALLGGVFALSIAQPEIGLPLFLAYILGFSIPLLMMGVFASEVGGWVERITRGTVHVQSIFGALLVVLGIFLVLFPPEVILKCF